MRAEEDMGMLDEKNSNLEKLVEEDKAGKKQGFTNKFKYTGHLYYYGDKNDIWNRKEESG